MQKAVIHCMLLVLTWMRKSELVPVPIYVHVTQLLNKIEKLIYFHGNWNLRLL